MVSNSENGILCIAYCVLHVAFLCMWYGDMKHYTSFVFKGAVFLENELATQLNITILTNSEKKKKKKRTGRQSAVPNIW